MKTARSFRFVAHLRLAVLTAAVASSAVGTSALLTACADENDPATWVKRLDDPAQRPQAIKRLSEFFDDTMSKAKKNREDPAVKSLLDTIAEPLTKQYTAGNLDDKTRKDLIKVLADTRDPRTAPALAKAFNEFEPKKTDEDVKWASLSVRGMAESGKPVDPTLVDALWNSFSKFRASQTNLSELVKGLHDALLAVKSPSYGPKCVEKLAAPVLDPKNPEQARDQIQFWQLTCIQVEKELKFGPAARSLVTVVLTPSKKDLYATASSALMAMPKEAEPLLISALNASDPDFVKLEGLWEQKSWVMVVADALAWLGRPAGRDAALAALAAADTDANRVGIAQALPRYPADPRIVPAFLDAYKKIPDGADNALIGGNPHVPLILAAPTLYDTSLTDWLLKEIATAKGEEKDATALNGLGSAIELMAPNQVAAVSAAVAKEGTPRETEMLKAATTITTKCGTDAACYVKVLDEPIPSAPPTANMAAVKACYMAGIYGNAGTRQELVNHLEKVNNPGARLALVQAVLRLAPQGDPAAAAAFEKTVATDKASGVTGGDDAVVKVALMLRSRAL
jgi:hypothetical protein